MILNTFQFYAVLILEQQITVIINIIGLYYK